MKTQKRKGMEFIREFPASEPIVSMVQWKDKLFVATAKGVYEIKDGCEGCKMTQVIISRKG